MSRPKWFDSGIPHRDLVMDNMVKLSGTWSLSTPRERQREFPPEKIKSMRKHFGLSISQMARQFRISRHTWMRWERGDSIPQDRFMAVLRQTEELKQRTKPAVIRSLSPEGFRQLREEKGLTQEQTAHKLRVTPRTILRYEQGETSIPSDKIIALENTEI